MSDPSTPPPERPSQPGLTSGDPLAGPSPAPDAPPGHTSPPPDAPAYPPGSTSPPPDAPAYPPGYTSPPPPGAFAAPSPPPFAPGQFRLSGWWRRVGAAVIDAILIGIVASLLLVPLGIGVATVDSDTGVAAMIGAFIVSTLLFVVVAAIYAPLMMSRTNGQTVGRMATGIRVIRATGQPMTLGFAAIREILVKGLLVGLAGNVTFGLAGLIDVLWPLWDEEHRALHDMVVNTRVVLA